MNVRSDNQNIRNLRTQLSNPVGSIQPKVKTHFRRSIGSSFPPLTGDSYRPFSAIFLFAEPIGVKWVGRCRIFFLKPSWEPDLGQMHGMRQRNAPKMVLPSRNLGSHSCNMLHDLALLQNGNEPPEHKNCFLSIGAARHNVCAPRQGPFRVLATGKPCCEKNIFKMMARVCGLC